MEMTLDKDNDVAVEAVRLVTILLKYVQIMKREYYLHTVYGRSV